MKKLIFLVPIILFYIFPPTSIQANKPQLNITFINPGISDKKGESGAFWVTVSEFMEAVAKDLEINLEILYAERNHLKMVEFVKKIVKAKQRPDYLITGNEKLVAGQILELTAGTGIKVFLFNNGFIDDQAIEYGEPRKKYPHWIGALLPDQRGAGAQIAKHIIDAALSAKSYTDKKPLKLFGITGDHATQSSIERNKGLEQTVEASPNVVLEQIIIGYWREDKAKKKFIPALQRYPNVNAVWAANDPMALGAMKGAIKLNKIPGKDIFFGGLNWNAEALQAVKEGRMVTSVGGHFMDGGWSLIMLYDYHHGKDFGNKIIIQPLSAITAVNVDTYLTYFSQKDWHQIDFTVFSKVLNPKLSKYNFNINSIFRQISK